MIKQGECVLFSNDENKGGKLFDGIEGNPGMDKTECIKKPWNGPKVAVFFIFVNRTKEKGLTLKAFTNF